MAETTMESLPAEVIEKIFRCDCLSVGDLARLGEVCCRFHELSQCQSVWKRRFYQRWPRLEQLYRNEQYRWLEEYRACTRHARDVRAEVRRLSPRLWHKEHCCRKDLAVFADMAAASTHPLAVHLYIQALQELINNGKCAERVPVYRGIKGEDPDTAMEEETEEHSTLKKKDLTEKYYAEQVVRFFQHRMLKDKWKSFLALPVQDQHLETGAVLLAYWCQTGREVCEELVTQHFDHFAAATRDRLRGTQGQGDTSVKNDVTLASRPRRQILEALNHVMFVEAGFHGNSEDYYHETNSYIDKVLQSRTGIPITLSVVYIAVARRLGVLLHPINYPSHFLVSFSESEDPAATQTYVDVFNRGMFLTRSECLSLPTLPMALQNVQAYFQPAAFREIYLRMVRNLVNAYQQGNHQNLEHLTNILELGLSTSPGDPNFSGMLVRLYIHLSINLHEADDILEAAVLTDPGRTRLYEDLREMALAAVEEQQREPPLVEPKRRTPEINDEVNYGIGMVVKHRKYHYTCMIYGWDIRCKATQHWIVQMGVNNLPHGADQPFYNVLVEDGSHRYAAQENLERPTAAHMVTHPEVGRYFDEYHDGYYHPNDELAARYPDDWEHVTGE